MDISADISYIRPTEKTVNKSNFVDQSYIVGVVEEMEEPEGINFDSILDDEKKFFIVD